MDEFDRLLPAVDRLSSNQDGKGLKNLEIKFIASA